MLRALQRRQLLLAAGAVAAAPLLPRPAAADPDGAYAYEWGVPWVPDSDSDIDVVEIPAGGLRPDDMPRGAPDRLLLLVAPQDAFTRFVVGRQLRYRGVVLVGATIRKVGGRVHEAPSGNYLPGGHTFIFQFDGEVDRNGHNPFLFLANLDFEAVDSKWGDFLQTGTRRSGDGDNFAQWCDVYLQKIRVGSGHYGWTTPGGNKEPHSDFVQFNRGGVRSLKVADCDVRWGYQTFFTRVPEGERPHPDGEHLFRRVVTRPMPDDLSVSRREDRIARYLIASSSGDATREGRYYPHRIEDWAAEADEDADSLRQHFGAPGAELRIDGNRLSWDRDGERRPLIDGTVRFGRDIDGIVRSGAIGADLRIADADSLRRIARIS